VITVEHPYKMPLTHLEEDIEGGKVIDEEENRGNGKKRRRKVGRKRTCYSGMVSCNE
jgi:hypothetical protein